jgi:hypothetical protein
MSSQKVHYDACPLGHAKLETTALYTRVAVNTVRDIKSPLDRLARISHTALGWGLSLAWGLRAGLGSMDKKAFLRGCGRAPAATWIGGATLSYVDCALSDSSARRRGEPGVDDPEFSLVREG